jgi:hypothetical protein
MTDAWVFPLGHLLGAFHPGRDEPLEYHRIRIGADVLTLSSDLALVWNLAHGVPGGVLPGQAWTRAMLTEVVGARGGEDAVAGLLDTGALVEVGPGALDATTFARGHRLHPLLVGLGVTPERPDLYRIGTLDQPVATVDELTFDMWQWAPTVGDLWELCEVQAATARVLGDEPDEGLRNLLWRLHVLLSNGCGYLDIAVSAATSM